MALEIRDYVARAKAEPTTENIEQLWRQVFLLKGWYFLPAESRQGCERPAVMLLDEEPWLVCFTNIRRLKDFTRRTGRAAPNGDFFLLVLDPFRSMQQIAAIADRIRGVVFNPDSPGTFRAPIDALQDYARHFGVPMSQ